MQEFMTSPSVGMRSIHSSTPEDDINFDELDRRGDEEEEDLDDFLRSVEDTVKDSGPEVTRIKTLEKSLEDEKRRLAAMELQLRDAKRARDADNQMLVVKKQTKMLEDTMSQLATQVKREVDQRQDWEDQWRERFDNFHAQHREMEDALKRKHLDEIKGLQNDIQKGIRRVAGEVQQSKGKNMPSPRTLHKLQESNMEKLVLIFHKHGQERLYLSNKVAKQEEFLVRSKNQSMTRMMNESQGKSGRLYKKYGLPSVKTSNETGLTLSSQWSSPKGRARSRGSTSQKPGSKQMKRSMSETDTVRSRAQTSWMSRTEDGQSSLPSPRINDTQMTFITAIDSEDTMDQMGMKGGTLNSKAQGTDGFGKNPAASSTQNLHSFNSTFPGSTAPSLPHAQSDLGLTVMNNQSSTHPFGTVGAQPAIQGDPTQEFTGWAPPQPPAPEGRPGWNDNPLPSIGGASQTMPSLGKPRTQQWHPNIIAFDSGSGKKAGSSPYLSGPVAPSSVKNGRKGQAGPKGMSRQGTKPGGSKPRSMSTEPRLQGSSPLAAVKPEGDGSGSGGKKKSTTFPTVAERKFQATDRNNSRPLTDIARNDDLPTAGEKQAKLEDWIEEKIKAVLGDGATRSGILDRMQQPEPTRKPRAEVHVKDKLMLSQDGKAIRDHERMSVNSRGMTPGNGMPFSEGAIDTRPITTDQIEQEDDRGPVGDLLNRLQGEDKKPSNLTSTAPPNLGFTLANQDDRNRGRTDDAQAYRGRGIDQDTEETFIPSTGKTTRDGRHVELEEADDVEERRRQLDTLANRPNPRTPKRVGWNLSPRASDTDGRDTRPVTGNETGGSRPHTGASLDSGFASSRPDTSASSYIGADDEDGHDGDDIHDEFHGEVPEAVVKDMFSKIRHNKVPEVEALFHRGFPLDKRDAHGNSPLMGAAQNGHKRLVKMCLKYGADPNLSNHQGNTALHFATAYGYTTLSKYLISKGADDTLMNMKGLTCYDGI